MKEFTEVFDEKYKDIKVINRAGQKFVYEAHHEIYGDVVIKLYLQSNDPRSTREIEIEKNLDLPMIPKIYETGIVIYELAETTYIVEQRINGITLREFLKDAGRFSLSDAVNFLEQGLVFIELLEQKGIVHRDIKPENIIKTKDGIYFFLDFGIARILDAESLTNTAAAFGPHTPGYAAPEQFNNLKDRIDSRADLFSLGVVTYECITGINPFSKNASSMLEVLQNTETITPLQYTIDGDSQSQFMALLSTMMSKYLSRRPASAVQALSWLNAAKTTFIYSY